MNKEEEKSSPNVLGIVFGCLVALVILGAGDMLLVPGGKNLPSTFRYRFILKQLTTKSLLPKSYLPKTRTPHRTNRNDRTYTNRSPERFIKNPEEHWKPWT
ncbi:MAG: hypothetical protein CMI18_09110 [Opitutaceae bacterium]|nr:hypothetical protein [Opitutaceae bacterium]